MVEFLRVMYQIIQAYIYVIFIYFLLSWTPLVTSAFYQALGKIVNPYIGMFRGKFIVGRMDLGGLVGLILLQVLLLFIRNAIY